MWMTLFAGLFGSLLREKDAKFGHPIFSSLIHHRPTDTDFGDFQNERIKTTDT